MKRALIIYNGIKTKTYFYKSIPKLVDFLTKEGFEVVVYPSQSSQDITNYLKKAKNFELLVTSGGDGTMTEVVNGLQGSKIDPNVLYFPSGTANDFAFSLNIGKSYNEVIKLYKENKLLEVDTGLFQDKLFNYVSIIGSVSGVSYTTDNNVKQAIGSAAYVFEALHDLNKLNKEFHVEAVVDGKEVSGDFTLAVIANSKSVGGFRNFFNGSLTDGKFNLFLLNTNKVSSYGNLAKTFVTGIDKDINQKGFVNINFTDLKIKTNSEDFWIHDGEKGLPGNGSYKIDVLKKNLKIYGYEK
jgi:diacylglycerol kinase (ATP)